LHFREYIVIERPTELIMLIFARLEVNKESLELKL